MLQVPEDQSINCNQLWSLSRAHHSPWGLSFLPFGEPDPHSCLSLPAVQNASGKSMRILPTASSLSLSSTPVSTQLWNALRHYPNFAWKTFYRGLAPPSNQHWNVGPKWSKIFQWSVCSFTRKILLTAPLAFTKNEATFHTETSDTAKRSN